MRGVVVAAIGVGVRFGYARRSTAGVIMHVRVAIIIGGLIAGTAWAPALAKVTHVRRATVTIAAQGAVHRTALKPPAAGKSRVAARPSAAAPPDETAGHGRRHRGSKAAQ